MNMKINFYREINIKLMNIKINFYREINEYED